jgi:hypothetical protein
MTPPIFTLSTGKVINTDKIKFDLVSRDRSKGDYLYIFEDDSEMYLTGAEVKELLALQELWRKAGMYNEPIMYIHVGKLIKEGEVGPPTLADIPKIQRMG